MVNITVENLEVIIEKQVILSQVTLSCPSGSMLALTGPSGCGKSTLLNAMGLILSPSTGDVVVNGLSTKDWNEKQRFTFWKNHAAFIYQDYGVIDAENIIFNVTLGGQVKSSQYRHPEEVLEIVGLAGREKELASTLSGGEKQRLGIARALYKNSEVIFADEPTASLDPTNRDHIINLLRLAVDKGSTVIVATHDPFLAKACTQQYEINKLAHE